MLPREVFLSHASQDQPLAARIRAVLGYHDIPAWFSAHHIEGGDDWQEEIGIALARCDWFAMLLTPPAIKSMWVRRELRYALKQGRLEYRIVPLLVQTCDHASLAWSLDQYQFIDFTGDFWDGCTKLLKVWGVKLKKRVRKQLEDV